MEELNDQERDDENIIELIDTKVHLNPKIDNDINQMLMAKFTDEEVYSALKGMGPTKASGEDEKNSVISLEEMLVPTVWEF